MEIENREQDSSKRIRENILNTPVETFAVAARKFCTWATSPGNPGEHAAAFAAQHLSALFAAGCALGWDYGDSCDLKVSNDAIESVLAKASALPFRYCSEIFNNLVIPPEEPVIGNIVDDLMDMYRDIAPGLLLFDRGEKDAAKAHWQFWLSMHWGEHATCEFHLLLSNLVR